MGTRGLLGFFIRPHPRRRPILRAIHNHYDSYPEALGAKIAEFIQSLDDGDIEKIKAQLLQIEWIDEPDTAMAIPVPEEHVERYMSLGFHKRRPSVNEMEFRATRDWCDLLSGLEDGKVLPRILDGSVGHLVDSFKPWKDWSYAYWIDFWEREVEMRGWDEGPRKRYVGFEDVAWLRRNFDEDDLSGGGTEEEDYEEDDDDGEVDAEDESMDGEGDETADTAIESLKLPEEHGSTQTTMH